MIFTVTVNDVNEWRQHARELLRRKISPEDINWQEDNQSDSLFSDQGQCFLREKIQLQEPRICKEFSSLAKSVACFRDPSRWALLYSVAFRLVFENKNLLAFKIDSQVARLKQMQKVIARDKHKMEAFVRFRRVLSIQCENVDIDTNSEVDKNSEDEQESFIAWFEPEHFILPITASFFTKRFNNMNWSILTPDCCAHWHQKQLYFTQGLPRAPKVQDDLEILWLEYYRNIFNPARLKLKAMQSEMPKKYWKNLPEAPLIKELSRSAYQSMTHMIEKSPSIPWQKTEHSRYIRDKQKDLRVASSNAYNTPKKSD